MWLPTLLLSTALAHDLGFTPIYVKLTGEEYKISVSLDPPDDVEDLGAWLMASEVQVPGQLQLSLGAQPVAGPPELIVRPRAADPFLLQYRGAIPDGASTFELYTEPGTGPWGLSLFPDGAPVVEALVLGGEHRRFGLDGAALEVPEVRPAHQAFLQYLWLGLVHIVPRGLDHVLFVLGLCLASVRVRALLLQISAFTVAHSLTLGAASLGWLVVPGWIVEPLIAASIVLVGLENLLVAELVPWRRAALVFGLGLLHGLGFASVLGELGQPAGQLLTALLAFNVGVELGQLLVVAVAMPALWLGWRSARARIQIRRIGSLGIAAVGLWWLIERVAGVILG